MVKLQLENCMCVEALFCLPMMPYGCGFSLLDVTCIVGHHTVLFEYLHYIDKFTLGPPEITDHPTGGDVPMGRSITLMCGASGLGTLVYSWERRSSGSSWTTVSNDNTTSYTTDTTLTIGEYMYRCRVSNEAGSVVSNSATVNVYGE